MLIILPHSLPHIKIRVTVDVSQSGLDMVKGVGLRMVGLASSIAGLLDWLTEATGGDTVSTEVNST